LISGENGTGKEVLARMIHNLSNRKGKPFVTLHAANISENNIEEILFGIDDGKNFRIGLLEKSNGGTLFIDEVSEMPSRVQTRFLKVIQENTFQKIGNNKQIPLDVRIITASSKNLLKEIETGNLNQSLYYRLNVVPLRIPPLRERKEDIALLFEYFNEQLSKTLGISKLKIPNEIIAILEIYKWPGNSRQLKNVIEWLMIIHGKKNTTITAEDLPDYLLGNNNERNPANMINNDMALKPLKDARAIFEKEYLKAQLDRFSGNISKTAEFVGMERTALHRKLKALNVAE
jgi:two-component system nitrogen regulation response regulator NtrX